MNRFYLKFVVEKGAIAKVKDAFKDLSLRFIEIKENLKILGQQSKYL